jgi:hypothetical protein
LTGYSVHPAATGEPVVDPPAAGLEVLLFWDIPAGKWLDGLNLSLRALYRGAQVVDPVSGVPVQSDRSAPVHGLWHSDAAYTQAVDGYHLPLPAPADSLQLIVYTTGPDGFHNLAVVDLSFDQYQKAGP